MPTTLKPYFPSWLREDVLPLITWGSRPVGEAKERNTVYTVHVSVPIVEHPVIPFITIPSGKISHPELIRTCGRKLAFHQV